jgi:hypothetical protein
MSARERFLRERHQSPAGASNKLTSNGQVALIYINGAAVALRPTKRRKDYALSARRLRTSSII